MLFVGCKVGCYAPTHDLLDLNLVPRVEAELDSLGILYKMNNSKHVMNVEGNRKIYFRSMDNPKRIVAYEVYSSHVDEADLMINVKKATESWDRIIARNRQKWMRLTKRGKWKKDKRSFNMVSAYSTPEGYKFTHKRWKKEPGEGYKYVQAPTSSNWNLDKSFIKNLKDTYTPEQCKAYLLGVWTNIFTGSVYSYFDRREHSTNRVLQPREPILVGSDFNYGGSCCSIYVPITRFERMSDTDRAKLNKYRMYEAQTTPIGLKMVDELTVQDTEQMVSVLQSNYSNRQITIFPDASGSHGNSNASISDISMLKQAAFQIKAHRSNPRIENRINSVQRLLYNNLFEINVEQCPKSAESMEEHAYSEITGLPEKFTGPATIDDRNDAMGYPPAFLFPIKKVVTTVRQL